MIPFSVNKYNTSKYNVVTRSGEPALIKRMIYDKGSLNPNWIIAEVPTVRDCLGNSKYGYTGNGRRDYYFDNYIDLMLVPKITWCKRIKSLLKRLK